MRFLTAKCQPTSPGRPNRLDDPHQVVVSFLGLKAHYSVGCTVHLRSPSRPKKGSTNYWNHLPKIISCIKKKKEKIHFWSLGLSLNLNLSPNIKFSQFRTLHVSKSSQICYFC